MRRAARLDLDEGQHGPASRDDVDLAAADALVDRDDAVGLLLKVADREALGRAAELVGVWLHAGPPFLERNVS